MEVSFRFTIRLDEDVNMNAIDKANGLGWQSTAGSRFDPLIIRRHNEDRLVGMRFEAESSDENGTRTAKRQRLAKTGPVVIDLTADSPTECNPIPHQLPKLGPVSRKRSHFDMTERGGTSYKWPSDSEPSPSLAPKGIYPYAKEPLPRFPIRADYEEDEKGRFFIKRTFGNYPDTVSDPSLQASWEAHIRKRTGRRRAAASKRSSGREQMRQEMNAEDDMSLSQGDVSKKGSAPLCNLAISKST